MEAECNKHRATKLVLRDFYKNHSFADKMVDKGFVIIDMPDTAVFEAFTFSNALDFEGILSKRAKRHFKEEVVPFCSKYNFSTKGVLTPEEVQAAYKLYANVKQNNLAINNFMYDKELIEAMNKNPKWKFILAKDPVDNRLLGVVFCFRNRTNNSFNPVLIGMENLETDRLALYRQLLFQTILHAKKMNFKKIYFGVSATFEKKKFGARMVSKEAYVQLKDQFVIDVLENFR